MSIDFAKQRENLAELASYIQQKQAKTTDVQSENVEAPGMLLAEQTEIQSDTLAPETVLTAATETAEVPGAMDVPNSVSTEVQSVQDSQGVVSEEQQMQADAFAQVAQVPGAIPVPEPMAASETLVPDNQPGGEAILDTSAANLGGASETVMSATQGAGVASEVAAMPAEQPAVGTVETPSEIPVPEPMPAPETIVPDSQLGGEVQGIMVGTDQPAEGTSTVEPMPGTEGIVQVPEMNAETSQSNLTTQVSTGSEQLGSEMQSEAVNNDIPLIAPIPDLAESNTNSSSYQTETYVATGSGAATEIADVTPVPASAPVVMPNGVTSDIANNPNLVVGPDSFGPTPSM